MVTRFPTILRDKDHMILAVPLCITESFAVWHDKLPLGETLSGSPKGVCRFDSRNCQTLGVPRQSRGFTLIKLPIELVLLVFCKNNNLCIWIHSIQQFIIRDICHPYKQRMLA